MYKAIELHPTIQFALLFSLALPFLLSRTLRDSFAARVSSYMPYVIVAASTIFILRFVWFAVGYLRYEALYDQIDAHIASVSWIYSRGGHVYHAADVYERYSLLYGPMVYIVPALVTKLFGPSMFSIKLTGVASSMLSLAFLYISLSRRSGRAMSVFLCSVLALIYHLYTTYAFGVKADPLILLFTSAGILACSLRSPAAATLFAASLGISVNLKFHAGFYFLPLFVVFFRRFGLRWAAISALSALLVAVLPFVCKNVSHPEYLAWLKHASGHGLELPKFLFNIEWAAYLFIPFGLLLKGMGDKGKILANKTYFVSLIMSSAVIILIASKPGAGIHHLLPLPLLFIFGVALTYRGGNSCPGSSCRPEKHMQWQQ